MTPGQLVYWFNAQKGRPFTCKKIPAVVKYVTKNRIAIEIEDKAAGKVIRYVPAENLEKR